MVKRGSVCEVQALLFKCLDPKRMGLDWYRIQKPRHIEMAEGDHKNTVSLWASQGGNRKKEQNGLAPYSDP